MLDRIIAQAACPESDIPNHEFQTQTKDFLTDILRRGAWRLLAAAIEDEVEQYIAARKEIKDDQGRQAVVRNGYLPERKIITGIGEIPVKQPRIRDRRPEEERERFMSKLLPPYLRKTKSVEEVVPWLYLKGIGTSDFPEALQALFGDMANGFSASTIVRLKKVWEEEYQTWNRRSLREKQYIYVWADGVHFNVRLEEDRQCILVLIGATIDGRKELIAIQDGYRESEQSWRELLLNVKARGLSIVPKLAIGDGALGFWKALRKEFPTTREQRCWVHKTANVLDKMPKSLQSKAKEMLHAIWMSDTRENAIDAFSVFVKTYEAKYPKAVECLQKDRDELLCFYDFPAEHWSHIRTTNPIESTFATVVCERNRPRAADRGWRH